MDLANEVSEAISQPQLFGTELDEDELNAELEELEQEELDKQLLNADRVPVALPKTPSGAVRQPQQQQQQIEEEEDDELAELRESMGMAV
ncbi:ESCRT-III subunit protein snf7 [Dipsacomyces acuminosporus]|nr:ESCRT-III subunit protein snf7 [Dipsacomyces acuminosporus]